MSSVVQVRALQPSVYIYCKNDQLDFIRTSQILEPLLEFGGEVQQSHNLGRESYNYLHHIIHFYDRLPYYVLFSQAQPEDEPLMIIRMQVAIQPYA